MATKITIQVGITLPGTSMCSFAMMIPNTEFTIRSSRKITIMKSERARLPTIDSVSVPIDLS